MSFFWIISILPLKQINEARSYLAHAKELQGRENYWPAWDDACVAISAALSAVINNERMKDHSGIYDDPNIANRMSLAKRLGLLPIQLCERAELILMQVQESDLASMSIEDSGDAIATAQTIIEGVERRIQIDSGH
jgi:hypothetical protein